MKRTEKHGKRRRINRSRMMIYTFFGFSVALYLISSFFVKSMSTELAVRNQELTTDIQDRSAAIEQLQGEVTQLQEKNRVLGMLQGQVSDDQGNVYYYDQEQ